MKFLYLALITSFFAAPVFAQATYKHCAPNEEKLKKIMDDRSRCTTLDGTDNSVAFYKALAEIAACDDYKIESISVVELYKTRGISLPCVIKIKDKDLSTSIGGGILELKAKSDKYEVKWDAHHDLTSKQRDLKFWLDQIEPQIIEALGE